MGLFPSDLVSLERREFLRRAAILALATSANVPAFAHAFEGTLQGGGGIPPLQVPGSVVGIVSRPGQFIALVNGVEGPSLWVHTRGDQSWSNAATAANFPEGTRLGGFSSLDGMLVAVGLLETALETVTVIDENGQSVEVHTHRSDPAIFVSTDVSSWEQVLKETWDQGGLLGAVTPIRGGTGFLAVGSSFYAAEVEEPYGIIALHSADGRQWEKVSLPGFRRPSHGDISLLVGVEDDVLIGTTGFTTTKLYRANSAARTWQEISAPPSEGPITYVAGAFLEGKLVVVTIDYLDRVAFWDWDGLTWSLISFPKGVSENARVAGFHRTNEGLLAYGSAEKRALVTQVGE